ncbi:MAG: hypothetical protein ABR562_03260, partial [Thermoplasmatota archaeon]
LVVDEDVTAFLELADLRLLLHGAGQAKRLIKGSGAFGSGRAALACGRLRRPHSRVGGLGNRESWKTGILKISSSPVFLGSQAAHTLASTLD